MTRAVYSPSFFATIAIGLSVGAHVLVLAVKFVPPALEALNNHEPIEVVLVNSKSDTKPLKDFKLAQADLDGGGNTDQKRSLSSPFPSVEDNSKSQQLEEAEQRRVELEQKNQQLLARIQGKSDLAAGDELSPQIAEMSPTLNGQDMVRRMREMEMLQAEIKKNQDEYQKRPRKNFIGARTKGVVEAAYVDAFRTKVERIGEQFYPKEVQRRKLYGSLLLNVEINKDGTLGLVEIKRSSGSPLLDQAALGILRQSAPFPKFPPELLKTTDILVISRHLSFTSSDRLETEAANAD